MVPNLTKRYGSLATFNPNPSTRTLLCICLVVGIGTWRHYETQIHPGRFQQTIWIEWLSWVVIYIASKLSTKSSAVPVLQMQQDRSFWSSAYAPWVAGVLAVSSQFLSSQQDLTWVLPLVTIVVTLAGKSTHISAESHSIYQEGLASVWALSRSRLRDNKFREAIWTLLLSSILNLICFVVFAINQEGARIRHISWQSTFLNSVLFLMTRSAAIIVISRLRRPEELVDEEHHKEEKPESTLDTRITKALQSLAIPMLAILTFVLVLVRPHLEMTNAALIAHTLAQATWWSALIILISSQLVNTVANLDTISLSAQIALEDIHFNYIALTAGCLSIIQSAMVVRLETFSRRILCLVYAIFLLSIWTPHDPSTKQIYDIHPIEELVIRNRATFSTMEARQSKTIKEATTEYWHRYRREPPKGFDKWFETAQANNFVLIDEFDTFMQSIEPFYGVDLYTLQQRLAAALNPPFRGLSVFKIESGKAILETIENIPKALLNSSWVEMIPYNMTVALNSWDVPMISVPWIDVNKAIQEAKTPKKGFHKTQESARINPFVKTGNQSGWASTSHACSADSPSRQMSCPEKRLATPLNFAHNITELRDTCLNCEILSNHGLSLSPLNLKVSHDLVPIWAHSKPSHFQDILYPAAYYIQVSHGYDPKVDSHWDEKDNKFYWVGSSTGGRATEQVWDKMHRQHFVIKTNHSNTELVQFLELSDPLNPSGQYQPRFSTWAEISDLFISRISAIVQCTDVACQIQKKVFKPDESARDPPEAAYSHKFVIDLDGNGHSGRYYRLLQSRSVVVKQTILKEWHDDRLVPWVHFVPLSTGYTELPEMARFLATTDKGLQLSERIARESTEWHSKALRNVDMKLVFWRMLLEYGRLMSQEA